MLATLSRWRSRVQVPSPPRTAIYERKLSGQVAQLVEHGTENAGVGGSIPPLATRTGRLRRILIRKGRLRRILGPSAAVVTLTPIKLLIAALLFAFASGCVVSDDSSATDPTTGAVPPVPLTAVRARVVHVTDGDTVVLTGIEHGEVHRVTGGHKARFIGVDTPEVSGGVECYGARASSFTRDALDGEDVLVDFDVDPVDRYGRALVYLWEADGAFFNGRLAREGFALQLTVPPNVRYAELFTTLVREARENDRGLWSGCAPSRALTIS